MGDRGVIFVSMVDTINIDSMLEETHTLTSTVTDHPVESGYNITDHARPDPDQVTLRCFVSNTPLSAEQQSRAIKNGNYQYTTNQLQDAPIGQVNGAGDQAYQRLVQLRATSQLVSVVTKLHSYTSTSSSGMIIQSITIPRTKENFDGLEFALTLKQIRIVQNRSASASTAKNTNKQTRGRVNTGSKPTTPVSTDDGGSLAHKLGQSGGLGGFVQSVTTAGGGS